MKVFFLCHPEVDELALYFQSTIHFTSNLRLRLLLLQVIYSGGEDLDVLPQQASKGKGLEFLLKEVRPPGPCTSWSAP